ncbi:MAG: glycosyltransferase family 2 protein [Pirellulales bacterium]|nr:glycosyltransferase family 2 protein [Pirellulales bacterium]
MKGNKVYVPTITVAIPTYNREQVLINTIQHVLAQGQPADEILVVDQTPEHESKVTRQLSRWHAEGAIRWLKQDVANLSAARNRALMEAKSDVVIFLDDDVVLSENFIRAHQESYDDGRTKLVAGQIIAADKPVHTGQIDDFELGFPLSHDRTAWIKNMGGGNFSVIRELAIEVGGFDQRFYRVAYREDSDFLFRFCTRYRCLAKYVPEASLVHLASLSGGCESRRAAFDPLACSGSVGEHYFTLKNVGVCKALGNFLYRVIRPRCGRFAARRPWLLPLMGIREMVAFLLAIMQVVQGRMLVAPLPETQYCD